MHVSHFAVAAAGGFFCCTGQYLFTQDGAAFYRLKKKITDRLKRA